MRTIKTVALVGLVAILLVPFACISAYSWLSLHLVYGGDRREQDRAARGY